VVEYLFQSPILLDVERRLPQKTIAHRAHEMTQNRHLAHIGHQQETGATPGSIALLQAGEFGGVQVHVHHDHGAVAQSCATGRRHGRGGQIGQGHQRQTQILGHAEQ
jgi:hypothetical protein